MCSLEKFLKERKSDNNIRLFFDIETFQYNEKEGREKPSKYKNMTFSVAVSWLNGKNVELQIFPNFKEFFDLVTGVYGKRKKTPTIELNAHNTNKYDNHFLRYDLLHYYPHMTFENYFLMTATSPDSNKTALRLKDLSEEQKKGVILEKRVKSSINLEMVFFLEGIQFKTQDNWVKTNTALATLGKKLLNLGAIEEKHLKTSFDYTKYNLDNDMTEDEAREYANNIYNQLDTDEITYIENDVILLANAVKHYSELFKGFDYSKMTFSSNILESYNTNNLTSLQMLNTVGEKKEKKQLKYTDYQFAGVNFYDYLKPFYRGGLNFYNMTKIGQIITDGVFSIDINSSYPYAMHNFKIPTFLNDFKYFDGKEKTIDFNYNEDEYFLFQMKKETFDKYIIEKIDSFVIKQMLVKYYTTNEFININSFTLKMLNDFFGLKIKEIACLSYLKFDTTYFGSKDKIEEYYEIKTRGSQKNKIDFKDPYNIKVLDEINTMLYSREEIDISKVNLNGAYGIPALRPYFNLFRYDKKKQDYVNIENGHKNTERNIVFSIFVTSVSLWNLLSPLKNLTGMEIDDNFLYCDTDSLYLKTAIKNKISKKIYSPFELGKWDIENENLKSFYVMNHKKYAYEKEDGSITVKSGGIPQSSFNTNLSFPKFIETQFSDGIELDVLKSIYNEQRTISIYPAKTKLELGKGYRLKTHDPKFEEEKQKMFDEIKKAYKDGIESDILYIESTIGTFSMQELFPFKNPVMKKEPLLYLQVYQDEMKKQINI